MPRRNYHWVRYWSPRENQITIGNDGLLYRVDSSLYPLYGLVAPQQLSEINSLLAIPCLILLGEPGMGKSFALTEAYGQLPTSDTDQYSIHNLADFESTDELIEGIFQNALFLAWQNSNSTLHIFLDSLDEARIHIRTITNKLARCFQENTANLDRLRIRITCRTSDWPSDFEETLQNLWGQENVKAVVLAPLQRQDVFQAVQQIKEINDADKFWAEVVEKAVEPFCARPITLDFLIDEYATSGQLPRTRKELYERGCKKLCMEFNSPHAQQDRLEPEQRFIVAARIAATTIFTGHQSIRLEELVGNPSGSLKVEDCADGKETISDLDLDIHDSYVRETLDTALFRGREIREWAHQTYAEFLAAWYVSHVLSNAQIKNLIFHPDGKLIPQLRETSAWTASFNPDIFEYILQSDPEVLLQSDVATSQNWSKEKLVKALLKWRNDNPYTLLNQNQLPALKYPGLAQTLRVFLQDNTNAPDARDLATDIAVACNESDLQDLMVSIALNEDEPLTLRTTCAQGVVALGDESTKCQLKPLTTLSLEENRSLGELKRSAILATWPQHLSAHELFSCLEVPEWNFLVLTDFVVKI